MKIKLFIIMTIFISALSCSKNTPSNPTAKSYIDNSISKKLENYGDSVVKNNIPIDDGSVEYHGIGKYVIKSLDDAITTNPENAEIYVDIYKDKKEAVIYIPNRFIFSNLISVSGKIDSQINDDKGTYILSMTVGDNAITDYSFTIMGSNEKYYITAVRLDKTK